MTATRPEGWHRTTQRFKFSFGEFVLFSLRLPAFSLTTHFTQLLRDGCALPPTEFQRDANVAVIPSQPVESDLPRLAFLPEAVRYVPSHYSHYYIELVGTFGDYLKQLPAKSRHEMLRKVRGFSRATNEPVVCREFRTAAEMAEFHALARQVSRLTYQERLLDAGLPQGEDFVRELEEAARRDEVRGYILCHDERPAAYGYCRAGYDVLFYRNTGYDPALRALSPGIVLLHELLRRVVAEERFRLFDFGSGNAQYKASYATGSARCATVYYFPRSIRGLLIPTAHLGLLATSDAIVGLLAALRLKARVKRLFRLLAACRTWKRAATQRGAGHRNDAGRRP